MTAQEAQTRLRSLADPGIAAVSARFFKTGPGEYGEGDLVDLSAPQIVGGHLENRTRRRLYRLAKSSSLWERRISVLATHWFIRQGDFSDTLKIAEALLNDKEDLIHKALGWMLREVGKRNVTALEEFLAKHRRAMPRTMLRYAVERFPEKRRLGYLKGTARTARRL